jgi:predicted DNA-binding transcriptional regulator
MVGDAWIHGAVPRKSAEQTLKTAEKEILKERENIEKMQISQKAIQRHKSVLLAKALLLANKTKKISKAIAQANRKEVQKSLEELEVESKMLKRLRKVSE